LKKRPAVKTLFEIRRPSPLNLVVRERNLALIKNNSIYWMSTGFREYRRRDRIDFHDQRFPVETPKPVN